MLYMPRDHSMRVQGFPLPPKPSTVPPEGSSRPLSLAASPATASPATVSLAATFLFPPRCRPPPRPPLYASPPGLGPAASPSRPQARSPCPNTRLPGPTAAKALRPPLSSNDVSSGVMPPRQPTAPGGRSTHPRATPGCRGVGDHWGLFGVWAMGAQQKLLTNIWFAT